MGTKPGEDGSPNARFAKIRANPAGRLTLKIGVGILGALVIALGLILIPLPGPGWAIVILGLAIWAIEYTWARRLLTYTKRRLRQWTHWIATRAWPTRAALGLTSLAVTAGIIWSSVRLTLGVDLTDYLDLTSLTDTIGLTGPNDPTGLTDPGGSVDVTGSDNSGGVAGPAGSGGLSRLAGVAAG